MRRDAAWSRLTAIAAAEGDDGALLRAMHRLAPRRVMLAAGAAGIAPHGWPRDTELRSPATARGRCCWLRRVAPAAAPRPRRPAVAILVRRPRGTRYLANWRELAADARGLGWAAEAPLCTEGGGAVPIAAALHRVAFGALARAHVALAVGTGSESDAVALAPHPLVVIEAMSHAMTRDPWTIDNAVALGHSY
eukprot:gene23169-56637_t